MHTCFILAVLQNYIKNANRFANAGKWKVMSLKSVVYYCSCAHGIIAPSGRSSPAGMRLVGFLPDGK